ncbi:MAG: S1 RNA-binding domain-containing protein [Bacillota bacterium]
MGESIKVGNVVEGTVTGITNFGAFVELPNGKTGLVHISEIADAYVHDVSDYVRNNDQVKVKVLSISDNGDKIGLSLRQANPGPPEFIGPRGGGGGTSRGSFEDKMQKFMKESDEKINEFRRNRNNRRGGREVKR